jgi:uncharacterized protein YndB with AHSA1/START domain
VVTDLHQIAPGLRIGAVGTQEMRVEREFPASPEAVFELFTAPTLIERWWPPQDTVAVVEKLELVPGGGWSMAVDEGTGAAFRLFGIYCDVNPPWGYVQSFEGEEAGHLWVEAVSLRPHGDGTLATNVGIMASAQARDQALEAGGYEGLRLAHARMKAALASLRA